MKHCFLLHLLLFALLAGTLPSCTSTFSVSFLEPAEIDHPSHIYTIAIANRTISDTLLTKSEVSNHCLFGLSEAIKNTPRYNTVEVQHLHIDNSNKPLNWDEVERLCAGSNADALLLLEHFDENVTISNRKNYYEEWTSTMKVTTNIGWRFYDPATRTILDEHGTSSSDNYEGFGLSENEAKAGLPGIRLKIKESAWYAGVNYASRIAPMYQQVSRYYYLNGSTEMLKGGVKAMKHDWLAAADYWQKVICTSGNPKLAGKAAYNMAVACEMEGKLNVAIQWAQKALYEYGNTRAGDYVLTLRKRVMDDYHINEQMADTDPVASSSTP